MLATSRLSVACNIIIRKFHVTAMAPISVGDKVPNVTLFEGSPGGKVELGPLCANKKVVIFGVPGAFTPGCSATHLPGYVSGAEEMKGKGVDEIVCVSVNDPFVMEAWGKDQGADGKVNSFSAAKAAQEKQMFVSQSVCLSVSHHFFQSL